MLKLKYGFTLIELLVVISIIGILAGLTLVSFTAAQKQARDTQRQSDLKQYQNLLEGFASSNRGLYPAKTVPTELSTLCGTNPLPTPNCPQDPSGGTWDYLYISNGTAPGINATQFVMWAYQEATGEYFIICSQGDTGTDATEPTTYTCPAGLQ